MSAYEHCFSFKSDRELGPRWLYFSIVSTYSLTVRAKSLCLIIFQESIYSKIKAESWIQRTSAYIVHNKFSNWKGPQIPKRATGESAWTSNCQWPKSLCYSKSNTIQTTWKLQYNNFATFVSLIWMETNWKELSIWIYFL